LNETTEVRFRPKAALGAAVMSGATYAISLVLISALFGKLTGAAYYGERSFAGVAFIGSIGAVIALVAAFPGILVIGHAIEDYDLNQNESRGFSKRALCFFGALLGALEVVVICFLLFPGDFWHLGLILPQGTSGALAGVVAAVVFAIESPAVKKNASTLSITQNVKEQP
jgi:hypothetical protein